MEDGSLCFSEWELITKEPFVLDNSLCYSWIVPSHRSLWPNGSAPKRKALSLLAEQTLRHKG